MHPTSPYMVQQYSYVIKKSTLLQSSFGMDRFTDTDISLMKIRLSSLGMNDSLQCVLLVTIITYHISFILWKTFKDLELYIIT
jgi:hypothetical protein